MAFDWGCQDVNAWAATIRDPFWHLQTDGTAGPSWNLLLDYSVHFGGPDDVRDRAVSRAHYNTPAQAMAATRLLQTYYETPDRLRLCPEAQGWFFGRGRVRTLEALAKYARSPGFVGDAVPVVGPLTYVLLRVFGDATGSRAARHGYREYETEVVAAATEVVRESRTSAFDAATWIPLWTWALGGPQGQASVRTRVFAMKAIQAILRRGALLPGQIRAADSLAAVLQSLVNSRAPAVTGPERELFLSEAAATVGAAAAALITAEMAAAGGYLVTPPPAIGGGEWVIPVVGGVAGLLLVGVAAVVIRRRAA